MQRFPIFTALVIILIFSVLCASGDKYIGGCYRRRMGCFNEPCKRRCRLLYGLDGYCKRTELCPKRRYRCKCTYRTPDHDTDDWASKWIIWLSKTIGRTQLITRRNELKGFIGSSNKHVIFYYLRTMFSCVRSDLYMGNLDNKISHVAIDNNIKVLTIFDFGIFESYYWATNLSDIQIPMLWQMIKKI